MIFASVWLGLSIWFAIGWAQEASCFLPGAYVWWAIIGLALLPGFMMSGMFFSNLLHWKCRTYPHTGQDTTVILCAHNEEETVARTIQGVLDQDYPGKIRVLVVDNASTDRTRSEIFRVKEQARENRQVEYLYCAQKGKAHALNTGLAQVETSYFITVDADTYLEKSAVQRIMDHINARQSACVAGNLFVDRPTRTLCAKMQIYDYLMSIAAIKRYQGSYRSTLVAQGAFSAYSTQAVREAGGWQDRMGEDIVLTYQLLEKGLPSTYEPRAVGYTTVPQTWNGLYNQRKRWAIGMLEGLYQVKPWQQGNSYSRYFTCLNMGVIYLDLAFLLGFIPGLILACMGCFCLVGALTIFTVAVGALLSATVYLYQKKLGIPFHNSLPGFIAFLLVFQGLQSTAALHGYMIHLFHRKGEWK